MIVSKTLKKQRLYLKWTSPGSLKGKSSLLPLKNLLNRPSPNSVISILMILSISQESPLPGPQLKSSQSANKATLGWRRNGQTRIITYCKALLLNWNLIGRRSARSSLPRLESLQHQPSLRSSIEKSSQTIIWRSTSPEFRMSQSRELTILPT